MSQYSYQAPTGAASNPFGDGSPASQMQQAGYTYQAPVGAPQQHPVSAPVHAAAKPAPNGSWQSNYDSSQVRENVTAAIKKEQSIVVPTMSDSMLREFNERNIARMQRMKPFAEEQKKAEAANPFDQIEATTPTAASAGHVESMPKYSAPQPIMQQQQPAPQAQEVPRAPPRSSQEEDPMLLGITIGFLRYKHDQSASSPSAELAKFEQIESEIRMRTGFGWPTYWQPYHGSFADFVHRHPECLTVIDGTYVVLKEHESEARSRLSQAWNTAPLNTMQPQHQQAPIDMYSQYNAPSQYHPQQQPPIAQHDSSYGAYQQQQPPYGSNNNPYSYDATPNNYAQQQQQQQQYAPVYQPEPPTSQYNYSSMGNYQQPQSYHHQQQHTPAVPSAPLATSGLDDGWVLFGNDSELNAPISNPFGASAYTNDYSWGNETEDPLAVFSSSASSEAARREEEERRLRKAQKKEERRKKKQESEDEALARKLQEEEDTRAASETSRGARAESSNFSSGGLNSGPVGTNRVALTHVEVRELAEEEIGKDNIRILAGFSVTKFGREGRPHQRKMWINSALTHLAWESSQYDGSHRGLELKQVVGMRRGEMTPTIRRSTKDARKVRSLCFSLETQARTLDLQACSVIQRDALFSALEKAIAFNHRHKPRRLDKYRTELLM